MKLENKVTNLEYAKRLDELGVKQDSIFYWCDEVLSYDGNAQVVDIKNEMIYGNPEEAYWKFEEIYSAFTASELLKLLGGGIQLETNNIIRYPDTKKYMVLLSGSVHYKTDNNACNALAKMLIHLIELGLIKVEDLK